jgi:Cdc6-like AAA superfamily ATPase
LPNNLEWHEKPELIDLSTVDSKIKEANDSIQQLSSSRHDDAVVKWLAPSDPSTEYNAALKERQAGTGKWFLDCSEYKTWKSEQSSFLWLSGNSGRGKTVLSSTIIQDLQESSKGQAYTVLYFYLSFANNRKQSLEDILRSLAVQLSRGQPGTRQHLMLLYSNHHDGNRQPSLEALQNTFRQMLLAGGSIYVVIDALDEYQRRSSSRSDLLAWIKSFREGLDNVHLLVTSRPEHDIESSIKGWCRTENVISLCTDRTGSDIADYIRAIVTKSDKFARWRGHEGVQMEIENTLKEKLDEGYANKNFS